MTNFANNSKLKTVTLLLLSNWKVACKKMLYSEQTAFDLMLKYSDHLLGPPLKYTSTEQF